MTMTDTKPTNSAAAATAKPSVFVDGGSGTTGLGIAERLTGQHDIAVKTIADDRRKDPAAKKATRTLDYYVQTGDAAHYYQSKVERNDYFAPDRDWYTIFEFLKTEA